MGMFMERYLYVDWVDYGLLLSRIYFRRGGGNLGREGFTIEGEVGVVDIDDSGLELSTGGEEGVFPAEVFEGVYIILESSKVDWGF